MVHRRLATVFAPIGVAWLLVLGCVLALPGAGVARANGVPERIQLRYLPNLSNFGPADATGEVELSYAEGLIRVTARGLQPLANGVYGVWLVKSGSNAAVNVGFFNAAGDGSALYNGKLPQLTSYDYDLVLLTVQPLADPGVPPSNQRSIGGYFAPIQKPDAGPTIVADTRPAELPNTGDPVAASATTRLISARHAAAAMLFAVGLLGLYSTYRLRRRPRP
jgi:hypothetical protein